MIKNKKILIIGGGGFFGSILSEKLLEKNYEVIVYDKLLYGKEGIEPFIGQKNYTFIKGCITNKDLLNDHISNSDYVINLAAFVGEPSCKIHKDLVFEINTNSAINVAEICHKKNKKIIFLSTCSNYGKNENIVDENSELNPLGLYSESKIKTENYIIENINNYLIFRCSTLFGVSHRMRIDLTINQFVYEILSDNFINVYGKKAWRPFLHVEDASNMIILSIENNLNGVYNLGDEKMNFSKEQIINELSKFKNFGTKEVIWDDPRDYKVDFSKFKTKINYDIKYDLTKGIEQLIDYFSSEEFSKKKNVKNF